MRKKKAKRLKEAYKQKVKKDKPFIDYIRNNKWKESNQTLAKELNISEDEVKRILWDYQDAFENDVFYKLDVERVLEEKHQNEKK